jgi:hypothetical protein
VGNCGMNGSVFSPEPIVFPCTVQKCQDKSIKTVIQFSEDFQSFVQLSFYFKMFTVRTLSHYMFQLELAIIICFKIPMLRKLLLLFLCSGGCCV